MPENRITTRRMTKAKNYLGNFFKIVELRPNTLPNSESDARNAVRSFVPGAKLFHIMLASHVKSSRITKSPRNVDTAKRRLKVKAYHQSPHFVMSVRNQNVLP